MIQASEIRLWLLGRRDRKDISLSLEGGYTKQNQTIKKDEKELCPLLSHMWLNNSSQADLYYSEGKMNFICHLIVVGFFPSWDWERHDTLSSGKYFKP